MKTMFLFPTPVFNSRFALWDGRKYWNKTGVGVSLKRPLGLLFSRAAPCEMIRFHVIYPWNTNE